MISFPEESTYKTLARALEPLELDGRLRYLPAFECCGSCAGARIWGYMEFPGDDWGDYEFFVFFNEQTKDNADDSMELWLTVHSFDSEATDEQEAAVKDLIAEALIAGGFEEIDRPSDDQHYGRASHDPEFRFNSFYREPHGIAVRGSFEGKARPTKAVRKRVKELQLSH